MAEEVNGIINVYKEAGFTSHDVVAKLRGILHQKKIGHTGTLDPAATGVLPVCCGKATKVCELLTDKEKSYRAVCKLGVITDTQDTTGTVLQTKDISGVTQDTTGTVLQTKDISGVTQDELSDTIQSFVGDIMQIPPMYSAIKVGGRKLYELAREGKEIERKPRPVTIYAIDIKDIDLENGSFTMDVTCSKGTYIRTLCHDIGEKLGVGAAMDQLLRTKVSIFEVDQALTLAQIEERIQQEDRSFVLPVDQLFTQYPKMQVADEEAAKMLRNGNPITIGKLKSFNEVKKYQNKSRVLVYNENGEFRAIYELRGNYYRVVKMF